VQLTMILAGLAGGERINLRIALGWTLAVAGLVTLVFPGVSAAPAMQSVLMLGAGVAWGVYSLRGRRSRDPLCDTAGNFARAVPGALFISAVTWNRISLDLEGIALAVLSGAIASGVGYAAWYTALPRLRAIAAANLQLSVPLLTSLGGIVLFGEPFTLRLATASVLLLGGITLATQSVRRSSGPDH
jgi:drug/metabolite transporter (DMT)-like permease